VKENESPYAAAAKAADLADAPSSRHQSHIPAAARRILIAEISV